MIDSQRLAGYSCSDLSDAMDRLGIDGQCRGILPLARGANMIGQAFTVRYGPVGADPGTVGDFIDDIGPRTVAVLDNSGRTDVTVWGDILTTVAHTRGVAGTVIDGVCRDIDRSIHLEYPVFSRGNWMRTGKDRVRVDGIGEPVSIGGVRVRPGDWLRGDSDGVVAIPRSRLVEVLDVAAEIAVAEEGIRAAVAKGWPLREARAKHGYHSLQSRRA